MPGSGFLLPDWPRRRSPRGSPRTRPAGRCRHRRRRRCSTAACRDWRSASERDRCGGDRGLRVEQILAPRQEGRIGGGDLRRRAGDADRRRACRRAGEAKHVGLLLRGAEADRRCRRSVDQRLRRAGAADERDRCGRALRCRAPTDVRMSPASSASSRVTAAPSATTWRRAAPLLAAAQPAARGR